MERLRLNIRNSRVGERGFTLSEVLITIALLGILLAIAVPTWQSVVESRKVDSAANQFVSDLRLAHTRATNQLTDWRLIYEVGEPRYHLVKLEKTCPEVTCADPNATEVISRELPDGTEIVDSSNGADPLGGRFDVYDAREPVPLPLLPTSVNEPGLTSTVELNSEGSSYVASGPEVGLKVGSVSDPSRCWKITVRAATSMVKQAKTDGCS